VAQGLLCDPGVGHRFRAGRERRYSILFFSKSFNLLGYNAALTFFAGAEPAAPDESCGQLDAFGGPLRRPAGANLISPHRTGWASRSGRSSRAEFI